MPIYAIFFCKGALPSFVCGVIFASIYIKMCSNTKPLRRLMVYSLVAVAILFVVGVIPGFKVVLNCKDCWLPTLLIPGFYWAMAMAGALWSNMLITNRATFPRARKVITRLWITGLVIALLLLAILARHGMMIICQETTQIPLNF